MQVYWRDMDPVMVSKNRKKGIMTDVSALSFIENQLAFGYSSSKQKDRIGTFNINLVALPQKKFTLCFDAKGAGLSSFRASDQSHHPALLISLITSHF
jgi:hypothetical protein